MHFIDQVDLIAASCRRVLNVIKQFARVFNASTRRSIHFNQIDKTTFSYLFTRRTLTTRTCTDTLFTVEAFGQNSSNGGLAHTARTGKQIGMMQTAFIQSID